MKFYFVRHGESEANILREISNRGLKHGLTEKGKDQAATLAGNLRDANVRRIYSSPLLRAIQTAEILSCTLGVPYETTDALREFDCGIAEGKADAESWALWRAIVHEWLDLNHYDARIEGGESFEDMRCRFVPFVDELVKRYRNDDGSIMLIGHGGLFLCMLPLVIKNIDTAFIAEHPLHNTSYIRAEPTDNGLRGAEWSGTPIEI